MTVPSSYVKVCGITRMDDARCVVDAGADAIGLNMWSQSPRYIELEEAARIELENMDFLEDPLDFGPTF